LKGKEAKMGIFKKKPSAPIQELKCPAEGCSFTCDDPATLKKHTDWKHPELTRSVVKVK
jgi:hypothetical protein